MSGVGEQVFVPRSPDAPEGDGYVLSVVGRFKDHTTELVILDTDSFKNSETGDDIEPVARIVLPFRMRSGVHGSWVPASILGKWQQLCDMDGVDNETLECMADSCFHGTGGEPIPGHENKRSTHLGGDEEGHAAGAHVSQTSTVTWGKHVNGVNGVK